MLEALGEVIAVAATFDIGWVERLGEADTSENRSKFLHIHGLRVDPEIDMPPGLYPPPSKCVGKFNYYRLQQFRPHYRSGRWG